MQLNRRMMIYIGTALTTLLLLLFFLKGIFFPGSSNPADPMQDGAADGGIVHEVLTIQAQEPMTIKGKAQLTSDQSYFYNPELGDIEAIMVKDGQHVKKGTVLYRYVQGGDLEDELEDAYRQQTRLYNQRVRLIEDLAAQTGQAYNYQGDVLASYWGEDGQQYFYVSETIGKGEPITQGQTNPEAEAPSNPGEGESPERGIQDQVREVNQQIEDIEVKISRLIEKQRGEVTAKYDGEVILDEAGRDNAAVPLVRIIGDQVEVRGSVTEYEFHTLGQDRPVNLYVNAEDRNVSGTMVDYDKVPPTQAAPTSKEDGGQLGMAVPSEQSSQYGFVIAPDEYIQPGFSVDVQLTLPGFTVPDEAIVEEGGETFVFLYRDGKAVKKPLTLKQQGLQRIAERDLVAGDQLILHPYDLQDGQEVSVMSPETMSMMEGEVLDGDVNQGSPVK